MLNLNYYFVDVGENCYTIAERSCLRSLTETLREKAVIRLKIAKEFVIRNFKDKCIIKPEAECKTVFVNKVGKIFVETSVETERGGESIAPIVTTDNFDVYIMTPGQYLTIKCQVHENQVENRYLSYKTISADLGKKWDKFSN